MKANTKEKEKKGQPEIKEGQGAEEELSIWTRWEEHLKIIEDKFGIKGKYVAGALGLALFFVLIGFLDKIITNLVGTLYPVYFSIKAIESNDPEMDIQWLTYWVVFAIFTFIDSFSAFILKFFPFYFFAKILFLMYLFLPNFQGATTLYNYFVVKIFKKFEKNIELASSNIIKHIDEIAKSGDLRKTGLDDKMDSFRSELASKKLD